MEEKSFGLNGGEGRRDANEQALFFGRLADRLRQKVEKAHFDTWLSRLQCRGAKDGILEFIAPNAFTKDWIQKHYHDVLRDAARSMDGRSWRILLYQGSDLPGPIEGHPCLGSFSSSNPSLGGRDSLGRREEGAPSESDRGVPVRSMKEGGPREEPTRDQGKEGDQPEGGAAQGGGSREEASPAEALGDRGGQEGSGEKAQPGGTNIPLFFSKDPAEREAASKGSKGTRRGRKQGGGAPGKSKGEPGENLAFFSQNSDSALNPGFTFENFVVGACNELTYAAAKAVAEFPGGPYNPLFIHGASGLGKTHLLQGICHGVLRGRTPRRILYLSCENFINQFIQAVTNGNISDFRYNCRHVDMLLVDDIQMLEGKSRTQEEFFHTFNTLFNNQKQIVLSSDRAPKELRTLQDRLISRFGWGMVTRLDSPCLETRIAIVKRKARMRSFELSDEVSRFLAEHVDTNVRELEGAVTKLLGIANLMKRRIDLSLAEEVLQDYRPSTRRLPIHKIMEAVAKEFGVQSRELQAKTRVHSVVLPRQIAILLARRHTKLSLKQIGGFFGDRNHATIMHSIKRAEQVLEDSEEIRERIQELTTRLLREA